MSFDENCAIRGSFAAAPFCGVVPVIWPNDPPRVVVGSPKFVWLNRLKHSARSWKEARSVTRKIRASDISTSV